MNDIPQYRGVAGLPYISYPLEADKVSHSLKESESVDYTECLFLQEVVWSTSCLRDQDTLGVLSVQV
jgi:hypothetical protein